MALIIVSAHFGLSIRNLFSFASCICTLCVRLQEQFWCVQPGLMQFVSSKLRLVKLWRRFLHKLHRRVLPQAMQQLPIHLACSRQHNTYLTQCFNAAQP